jgi:hypothetical protein
VKAAAGSALIPENPRAAQQAAKDLESAVKQVNTVVNNAFRELGVKTSQSIENQKQAAISAFNAIKSSGVASAQDVANAQAKLTQKLAELDRQLDQTGESAKETTKEINALAIAGQKAGEGYSIFKNVLANLATSVIQNLASSMQQLAGSVIQVGAQTEKTAVAFETFLGSAEEAKRVMKEVRDFAATTPFELPEVTEAAKQLLATKTPADQLIPTIKMLGEIAAGADKPLSQLLFVYTQIKNQGRALGQDINQLLNAGLSMEDIAKALGKSAKELGQIKGSSEGLQLSFEEVDKVLRSVTSEGGRFFGLMDKLGATTAVKLSNLNDAFTKIYNSIYQGISPALSAVLDIIVQTLDPLGNNQEIWKDLNAQAQSFKDYISQNPGIAKALNQALTSGVKVALQSVTELAKGLLQYLQENPRAIQDAVEAMEGFVKVIGLAVQAMVALGKEINKAGEGWEWMLSPEKRIARQIGESMGEDQAKAYMAAFEAEAKAWEARGMPMWFPGNRQKVAETVAQNFMAQGGGVPDTPGEMAMRSSGWAGGQSTVKPIGTGGTPISRQFASKKANQWDWQNRIDQRGVPDRIAMAAGHSNKLAGGAPGEQAFMRQSMEAMKAEARARGINLVVLDPSESSKMNYSQVLAWLQKKEKEGFYSVEIHGDMAAPGGRSGMITGKTIHEADQRLAKEFGAFSYKHREGQLGGPPRGVSLLELASMFDINKLSDADKQKAAQEQAARFFGAIYGSPGTTADANRTSQSSSTPTSPLFSNPIAKQIYDTARQLGLDPSTAIAIAAKESGGGNPQNITHLNRRTGKILQSPSTNAYGPFVGSMQVGWGAAVEAGYQKEDRYDPQKNIEIGIRYFQKLLVKFNGDTRKALAAYNAGPGNLSAGYGYADSVLKIKESVEGQIKSSSETLSQLQNAQESLDKIQQEAFNRASTERQQIQKQQLDRLKFQLDLDKKQGKLTESQTITQQARIRLQELTFAEENLQAQQADKIRRQKAGERVTDSRNIALELRAIREEKRQVQTMANLDLSLAQRQEPGAYYLDPRMRLPRFGTTTPTIPQFGSQIFGSIFQGSATLEGISKQASTILILDPLKEILTSAVVEASKGLVTSVSQSSLSFPGNLSYQIGEGNLPRFGGPGPAPFGGDFALSLADQQKNVSLELEEVNRRITLAQLEQNAAEVKKLEILREQLALRLTLLEIQQRTDLTTEEKDRAIQQETAISNARVKSLEQVGSLAKELEDIGRGALSTFFENVLSGTQSLSDAFGNMARSILQTVSQLAAQLATVELFKMLGLSTEGLSGANKGGGGGFLGMIGNLFGGLFGFASGGYTGPGSPSQPAGIVHRGEFVLNAAATRNLGPALLASVNQTGRLPVLTMAMESGSGGGSSGGMNVTIQNVYNNPEDRFRRSERSMAREQAEMIRRTIR